MSAKEIAAFLGGNPVFAGIPVRELESLARAALEESHRIVRHSTTGKDVVLELLGPGEIFGGVAAIEKRPYPASAQASEPTVVLKIAADPMIALAERHPAFIKEMALMIGRRLRSAHDSVASLAVDPVEARLAAMLLRLAKREGTPGDKGVTLPFHLTRQSLADMTGTTVETAIRILSRWLRDGLLDDDGGRLVLTDWEGLSALAEGAVD